MPDAVSLYLDDLRRGPRWDDPADGPLSPAELAERNAALVVTIARSFLGRAARLNYRLDDLIGWGNVGLVVAAVRFDRARDVAFSTYATYYVRCWISAGLDASPAGPLSVPRNLAGVARRWAGRREELRMRLGRPPRREEVDATLNARPSDLRRVALALRADRAAEPDDAANAPARGDDDAREAAEAAEEAARLLGSVTATQARVLRLRFGLDGGREHTFDEVGALLGISKQAASMACSRAFARLREVVAEREVSRAR